MSHPPEFTMERDKVYSLTTTANTPENNTVKLKVTDAVHIDSGAFGQVCSARVCETGQRIAIKKLLEDPRYQNRELAIMRELHHKNIVDLKFFYYEDSGGNKYLNLLMEYIPSNLYKITRQFNKQRKSIPIIYVQVYAYQMFRALEYLHGLGIAHRDIKTQNLLVDPATSVVKLCDFGSAKRLRPNEVSVAYICSRYYRAPELILGVTTYTTSIDMWSAGTVVAELLRCQPLFAGEESTDQIVEIIKLGTPSQADIRAMNPAYKSRTALPIMKPSPWTRVLSGSQVTPEAISLVSELLKYRPLERLTAQQAAEHRFFAGLHVKGTRLPAGAPMPPL